MPSGGHFEATGRLSAFFSFLASASRRLLLGAAGSLVAVLSPRAWARQRWICMPGGAQRAADHDGTPTERTDDPATDEPTVARTLV
jgi:hypothetical protein